MIYTINLKSHKHITKSHEMHVNNLNIILNTIIYQANLIKSVYLLLTEK